MNIPARCNLNHNEGSDKNVQPTRANSQRYGACNRDRAEVLDLPDFAAVRFEVASVDGRVAAVAAREVESSDSPVSNSSI